MRSQAYITGLGIVSPIGTGAADFVAAVREGRKGSRRLERLDAEEFRIGRGGEVDDAVLQAVDADATEERCLALSLLACDEALTDAGVKLPEDATLSLGTGAGEMRVMERTLGPHEDVLPLDHPEPLQPPNMVTTKLAGRLGLRGRRLTFINACAAGAQAISVAGDLIRAGRAEVALAGGVEILSRMVMSGFEALRAVSPTECRPFDEHRDGIHLGELAAFVVLESGRRVEERGAEPYALLAGSGSSADASHVVRPDQQGAGAALAIERALADAGLTPDQIDYVNAHGTGTEQNDSAELAAIETVFGESAAQLPISSTKSMLGHALAASGAAEVVICSLALRNRFLPPTVGLQQPISGYESFDFVPEQAREGVVLTNILSNTFAFGGNNVVLVLSSPGEQAAET